MEVGGLVEGVERPVEGVHGDHGVVRRGVLPQVPQPGPPLLSHCRPELRNNNITGFIVSLKKG